MVNPLKIDPSRTKTLRDKWVREFNARFNALKGKINRLVIEDDAFGWRDKNQLPTFNTRWRFLSDDRKLEEFKRWIRDQLAITVLARRSLVGADDAIDSWLHDYIEQAYNKGVARAFDDVRRPTSVVLPTGTVAGAKQEFIGSFGGRIGVGRVKLLASRALDDLVGVTDAMATKMGRILVDGMIEGKSPWDVAREINKEVSIGANRAKTIARTETLRAHNEGALDAMEDLGVDKIGVMVEWDTTEIGITKRGYPSPCPLCAPLDGMVLTLKEAHGMFPRHPNCMCVPIPANVGEPTEDQKRGKARLEKAIERSLLAEIPKKARGKRSIETQRKRSSWTGANKKFSKKRPKKFSVTK